MGMSLLPPAADKCPICATEHEPQLPHNPQSLYYFYRFHASRGDWPTCEDAAAHCTPQIRASFRDRWTYAGGKWTRPLGRDPLADPPAESINQVVEIENAGPEIVAIDEH